MVEGVRTFGEYASINLREPIVRRLVLRALLNFGAVAMRADNSLLIGFNQGQGLTKRLVASGRTVRAGLNSEQPTSRYRSGQLPRSPFLVLDLQGMELDTSHGEKSESYSG